MYRIDAFDTNALVALRETLHDVTRAATSMERIAVLATQAVFNSFATEDGRAACALVRFYKTHRFADLTDDRQAFARRLAGGQVFGGPGSRIPCLTLLGTAGVEFDWSDVRRSAGHQAIPLAGTLEAAPMIAALVRDLGVDEDLLLRPPPDLQTDVHLRQYNVFHVADAVGSAAVPDQQFVERYGIRSVVGFGGMLASGDMFAMILFTTIPVPETALANFRTLSLTIKSLIVPHTYTVFEHAQ